MCQVLMMLSIQCGYPFSNLHRAPKTERVEYRMVFLLFGGGEGATVDFVWIRASFFQCFGL